MLRSRIAQPPLRSNVRTPCASKSLSGGGFRRDHPYKRNPLRKGCGFEKLLKATRTQGYVTCPAATPYVQKPLRTYGG